MNFQWEVYDGMFDARIMSFALAILSLLAAGCAGAKPATNAPSTTDPTPVPAVTEMVSPVSDEQLATATAFGDIGAGEKLFSQPVDRVAHSFSCSTCHSLDGKDSPDGPTLAGISVLAAVRVAGMSAVDYLRQSIVDPSAYMVDGDWRFGMPPQYPEVFSEDEIDNLVAFLLTR